MPLSPPKRAARALVTRFRQRRHAAGQLVRLAGRAGAGLLAATVALHLLAGAMPILFLIGVAQALHHLAAGLDTGPTTGAGAGLGADADVGAGAGGAMVRWLAVALAAFVAQQLLAAGQLVASQAVARRVDAYCSTRLMRSALDRTPLPALERADIAAELDDAARALEHMAWTPGTATEGALALIPRYVQLTGAVAVVAVAVHPWAALAAAAVALVNRRGQTAAFFRWGQLTRRLAPARKRLGYLRDLATGTGAAKEIRTLGLVDWIDDRYARESRDYLVPLQAARRRLYGRPFAIYTVLGLIGAVAALLALTGLPAGRTAELAGLTMGLQATVLCLRFGVVFPESDVKMVHGRAAWESLLEFERRAAAIDPAGTAAIDPAGTAGNDPAGTAGNDPAGTAGNDPAGAGTTASRAASRPAAPAPRREIAFERVSFGYDPGRPVLDGLDLRLPVGTSTALVGVNGAGKTTLVKLLTGLYRPGSGRITCDGVDLAGYHPESWRRHFAVTFQDFVRYDLTLRENVAVGAVEHLDDDAGIRAVLDRVGLADLVRRLPDGLRTPLTRLAPGGRDLSGGQWQRLALARSLFAVRHGASVLVLDEPTAQLDARGEARFLTDFLELTSGVTSLVISHRFSSVRRADRVVVIDQGRLVESGSHDELLTRGGEYAQMFTVQARRFAEPVERP